MRAAQKKHFARAEGDLAMAAAHLEEAARSLLRAAAEAEQLRLPPDADRHLGYSRSLLDERGTGLAKTAERIAEMADQAGALAESCSA